MKISLVILFILAPFVSLISQQNIVIGIYTQKYFYGDHMPVDGSILTYLPYSYANLASMTGAKVVPIYSYSRNEDILNQLSMINGIIFTGGQQYININNTWTANALTILQYSMAENNAGRTFPILGICQGLELLLYLTSDMRENFLDQIKDQNGVWNTVKLTNQSSYLLNSVSNQTLTVMQDPSKTKEGGPMYFFHSNGTLLSTFLNDKQLQGYWNLIGTTSKSGQTFVTYLQAKKYPFYILQFHPERLSFASSLSDELFYARGELSNAIALNFAFKCKQSPHRYPKEELQKDCVENFQMFDSVRFSDYKVYLFYEWNSAHDSIQKQSGSVSKIGLFMAVVFFVGIFAGVAYYLFKKRSERLNEQINLEVFSPIQREHQSAV